MIIIDSCETVYFVCVDQSRVGRLTGQADRGCGYSRGRRHDPYNINVHKTNVGQRPSRSIPLTWV